MTKFDWPELMKAGMTGLGLSPDAFWQLTPAEFSFLMGDGAQGQPLDRTAMDAFLAQFPDQRSGGDGSD